MKPSTYPMQSVYCGAKTRNGGKCRNHPVDGAKRCRMHGGKSKSGVDHGRYTEGFYTREAIAERRKISELMRMSRELLKGISCK